MPVFCYLSGKNVRGNYLTTFFLLAALLALTALYVAAEFASVSLPKGRLQALAERGDGRAIRLLGLLGDAQRLDRYIAACQVGITWTSLVLGAYGQASLAPPLSRAFAAWFGWSPSAALSVAVVAVLIALTLAQMVLGELLPKSLALHDPLRTALATAAPMRWSLLVYSGFITFLNGSGNRLIRLFGGGAAGHGHIHSPEEIGFLISGSEEAGQLETLEEERLQGALKLGTRPVRQLMTPRPMMRGIPIEAEPGEVLATLLKTPYSRLPVFDGESVAGILLAKDVFEYRLDRDRPPSVEEVLRPALFVPETMTADKLYRFLREQATHVAMVIDEFGAVVGLVTLDDLVAEMLGDMPDEFKRGPLMPEPMPDGRIRIFGSMRMEELADVIGTEWQGTAATAGGMLLEILGHLPAPGEKAWLGEAEIEAERVEGNVIASMAVRLPKPGGKADA
jgi:putative hemolysin